MGTTINQRFVELIKAVNMNTNSFSKSIDKAYTSVEAICKGKTKPSYELLESVFLKYPKLSRDWLLMGDGEMYRSENQTLSTGDDYLREHIVNLEGSFKRLSEQFDSQISIKDQQIAGLQRTVDALVGKSEGATDNPLSFDEFSMEMMYHHYTQSVRRNLIAPVVQTLRLSTRP